MKVGNGAPALQGKYHFDITPSDTVDFKDDPENVNGVPTCRVYVGTGGDVAAVTADGRVKIYKNVPSGTFLPVTCKRINLTGTATADDMLGVY